MSEGDSISQIAPHPIYDKYIKCLHKGGNFLKDEPTARHASIENNHLVHTSSQIHMNPINQSKPISLDCQHVVDEIYNHEINDSPQNDLWPIYENYHELVGDEHSVLVRSIVYNKVMKL